MKLKRTIKDEYKFIEGKSENKRKKKEKFFVNPLQRCTRLVIVWISKQTDSLPSLKLNWIEINGSILVCDQ